MKTQQATTKTYDGSNPAINRFIIETALVNPIADIIGKLKKGEFRDCDIKWLDGRMESFVKRAADLLEVKSVIMPSEVGAGAYTNLNDYVTTQYITRFTTLRNYFNKFE